MEVPSWVQEQSFGGVWGETPRSRRQMLISSYPCPRLVTSLAAGVKWGEEWPTKGLGNVTSSIWVVKTTSNLAVKNFYCDLLISHGTEQNMVGPRLNWVASDSSRGAWPKPEQAPQAIPHFNHCVHARCQLVSSRHSGAVLAQKFWRHFPISPFITESIFSVLRNRKIRTSYRPTFEIYH